MRNVHGFIPNKSIWDAAQECETVLRQLSLPAVNKPHTTNYTFKPEVFGGNLQSLL